MAAREPPFTHSRVIEPQPVSTMSAFRKASQTSRFRNNLNHTKVDEPSYELSTRTALRFNVTPTVGISQGHGLPLVLETTTTSMSATRTTANKNQNHATIAYGASGSVDKYGQCKCIEDAFTSIMKDTIQHCLHTENDAMRGKVVDQMGKGLAALCRVAVGVAAESSSAPIPIASLVPQLSTIKDEDLEQVRRLLQLTSLPFNSTDDEDFKRLTSMLQKTGDGQDSSKLSESELSQICERLGSDLLQCLGPMVMCFPEFPLWAKHRALLLPAEIARKVALSLLTCRRS